MPQQPDDDLESVGNKISDAADEVADNIEAFRQLLQKRQKDIDDAVNTIREVGKSLEFTGQITSGIPERPLVEITNVRALNPPADQEYIKANINAAIDAAVNKEMAQRSPEADTGAFYEAVKRVIDRLELQEDDPPPAENEAVEIQPADNERDVLLKFLPWVIIAGGIGLYVVRKK